MLRMDRSPAQPRNLHHVSMVPVGMTGILRCRRPTRHAGARNSMTYLRSAACRAMRASVLKPLPARWTTLPPAGVRVEDDDHACCRSVQFRAR